MRTGPTTFNNTSDQVVGMMEKHRYHTNSTEHSSKQAAQTNSEPD